MVNSAQTPEGAGTGQPFPIPSPMNGLNTRENFTKLLSTEARVLRNLLPDEGSCIVRPGHASHATITGASTVPTLMVWKGATGKQLIAGANGELHDVTTSTVSTFTAASYASDLWSWDNFNGYLFGVNGTSTPWRYDGTNDSATGFTGPTLTSISTIKQIRDRLWVTINNSADVYYGGVGAVTGALTVFQLSQIATGGKCIGLGSWSRDAGDGADDLTVFIMDTGQVIVYQGNPATNFTLVGKFPAPVLVEADATVKVGGELVLMTVSGPIPLSAVMAGVAFSPDALKDWGKVAPSWQADYQRYKANSNWTAYFFNGIVYFNFPTGTDTTLQYVYNTRVPAWTTYTDMPAGSFADLNGVLYFGSYSSNKVFSHTTGSDNGVAITTLSRQGATYPTQGSRSMRYNSFRPNIDANGPAQVQFGLDVDFKDGNFSPVHDISVSAEGGDWGDDWGTDWGAPATARRKWYSTRGYGRAVAPALRTISTAQTVVWSTSDIRGTPGGQL